MKRLDDYWDLLIIPSTWRQRIKKGSLCGGGDLEGCRKMTQEKQLVQKNKTVNTRTKVKKPKVCSEKKAMKIQSP